MFPGLTSKELAGVTDLDRYMLARRLPEAERHGKVKRLERTTGVQWWPT